MHIKNQLKRRIIWLANARNKRNGNSNMPSLLVCSNCCIERWKWKQTATSYTFNYFTGYRHTYYIWVTTQRILFFFFLNLLCFSSHSLNIIGLGICLGFNFIYLKTNTLTKTGRVSSWQWNDNCDEDKLELRLNLQTTTTAVRWNKTNESHLHIIKARSVCL